MSVCLCVLHVESKHGAVFAMGCTYAFPCSTSHHAWIKWCYMHRLIMIYFYHNWLDCMYANWNYLITDRQVIYACLGLIVPKKIIYVSTIVKYLCTCCFSRFPNLQGFCFAGGGGGGGGGVNPQTSIVMLFRVMLQFVLSRSHILLSDSDALFMYMLPQNQSSIANLHGIGHLHDGHVSSWLELPMDDVFSCPYDQGPLYWHGLTYIPAWLSNHMSSQMWDDITYSFPNCNSCAFEVWERLLEIIFVNLVPLFRS